MRASTVFVAVEITVQAFRAVPERHAPAIAISFYDENRVTVGEGRLGPWRGTFDWQSETRPLTVPPKAREAVMRIGLLGAVGEISFDEITMKAVGK